MSHDAKTPAGSIVLDDGPTGVVVDRRPAEALTIVQHYPATVLHVVEPDGRVLHVETPGADRALTAMLALRQEFAPSPAPRLGNGRRA
jgi:hypothetical protein